MVLNALPTLATGRLGLSSPHSLIRLQDLVHAYRVTVCWRNNRNAPTRLPECVVIGTTEPCQMVF